MFPLKPIVKTAIALVVFIGIIVTGEILREKQKQHLRDTDSTDDKEPTEDSPIKLKLSANQVQDIRGLRDGVKTSEEMAKIYQLPINTIFEIQLGKLYAAVPNPDGSKYVPRSPQRQEKTKLTADQIQRIRALRGNEKQDKTAKDYGTSVATVSKIQLGKAYKDVPNPDGFLFVPPVTKKSTK